MALPHEIRNLIIGRLRWFIATGDRRDAEILALRHQILAAMPRCVVPTTPRSDYSPAAPPLHGCPCRADPSTASASSTTREGLMRRLRPEHLQGRSTLSTTSKSVVGDTESTAATALRDHPQRPAPTGWRPPRTDRRQQPCSLWRSDRLVGGRRGSQKRCSVSGAETAQVHGPQQDSSGSSGAPWRPRDPRFR